MSRSFRHAIEMAIVANNEIDDYNIPPVDPLQSALCNVAQLRCLIATGDPYDSWQVIKRANGTVAVRFVGFHCADVHRMCRTYGIPVLRLC